jgi:hypothetical protein
LSGTRSNKGDRYPIAIWRGLVFDRIGKLLEQLNAMSSSGHVFERAGDWGITDEEGVELRGLIFNDQSEGAFSIDAMTDHNRVIWFARVAVANDI